MGLSLRQTPCATYRPTKLAFPPQRCFTSHTPIKPADTNQSATSKPAFDPSRAPYPLPLLGPSWLWAPLRPFSYPIAAYHRASSSRPYRTQFVSSLAIFFLGDLLSQCLQQPTSTPSAFDTVRDSQQAASTSTSAQTPANTRVFTYDPQRSLRALVIGGIISIPSYHWFMYLAKLWPTLSHTKSLLFKVTLNSIIFAPLLNTYFFTMQALLTNDGGNTVQGKAEAVWIRVNTTLLTSWLNGMMFWPVITAFSFTFVAPRSRSIFNGVAAIGWQAYLGLLNHRAAMRERGAGGAAAVKPGRTA